MLLIPYFQSFEQKTNSGISGKYKKIFISQAFIPNYEASQA
jgi:hypothetical protein